MYVERFMSFLRFEKHYSEHTLKAYEKDVRSYLQFWVAEQISFEEVGHKQLRYYLSILMDSGLEASSIRRSAGGCR
jgi:integrase/recombinase XerC